MKKFLLLLLLPLSFYAQNDSIKILKPKYSVVGLDAMNFVYRGFQNPISIAVNNAKSYKVSGEGVSQKEDGKYIIKPKAANETKVVVEIETTDSTKVYEEHTFKVKPLPLVALLVNKKGCISGDCTLEIPTKELQNAEITVKLIDFLLDYSISVKEFRLYLTNANGDTLASYEILGNKIPQDIFEAIVANDKATLIVIHKIIFSSDLIISTTKTPIIKIRRILETK